MLFLMSAPSARVPCTGLMAAGHFTAVECNSLYSAKRVLRAACGRCCFSRRGTTYSEFIGVPSIVDPLDHIMRISACRKNNAKNRAPRHICTSGRRSFPRELLVTREYNVSTLLFAKNIFSLRFLLFILRIPFRW